MHKRVNICLKYDVYAELRNKGRFGESFSELVSRILNENNDTQTKAKPMEVTKLNV